MNIHLPPDAETHRLNALASYTVLDTLPEDEYDAITQLAARICQTPVSLISLIDENRQWFKSAHGLTIHQTPREHALCAYAILTPDRVMEVYDARTDARFTDNPLITGDPHVVFYAGTPLVDADGHTLGTLCVIDHQPRHLMPEQILTLQALGKQVVAQLQLHRSQTMINGANKQLLLLNQELQMRQQNEQRLQHMLAQEKELREQKSQFVTMVSHEFRTPITTIQLSVDLIRLYLNNISKTLPSRVTRQLDTIEVQVIRFTDLLSDVLTLGQIDTGKLAFKPVLCDAEAFVRVLIDTTFGDQLMGRTIPVSVRGLPRLVPLDKRLLKYALVNLLSNALKFSTENPELTLSFELGEVILAVSDKGIGIPAEDLPHLFTSFFRAGNSGSIQGTGLGLFIARQFVELHGGRIEVSSQLGQGSTFCIILPTPPPLSD